jgi:uncharacterized membrane protein YphA (DoxX/SURF4 family)
MAYSHSRLRRMLAVVRVLTGVLFLFAAAHKISSWEFAKVEFPQFVSEAAHGAAVGFYGDFFSSVAGQHLAGFAALAAFIELFIGVGLVLGLAIRPISILGSVYMVHLMLATWNVPGPNEPMWRYLDNGGKLIPLLFLFVLFGFGHAGENWGLGSLYHHRRHRKWKQQEPDGELETSAILKIEPYSRRYRNEKDEHPQEAEPHTDFDRFKLRI